MVFTALTYNLHKGRHFFLRRYVIKELTELLVDLSPDVVFLQEAMGLAGGLNHIEYIAKALGYGYAYGLNASKANLHYGNAILSKFPIIASANKDISTNRFERRGSLQAKIELGTQDMMLICLHLDLLEGGRALQIQNVIGQIRHQISHKTSVLLAGDFNDWRGRVCSILENELGMQNAFQANSQVIANPNTFPSFFPSVSLDRFYLKGLQVLDIQVLKGNPWNRLSDHCPVFATFEI